MNTTRVRFYCGLVATATYAATTTTTVYAQNGGMLEEVIVTAQKRAQNLQDVPISVTAFSEDMIDNLAARDIGELAEFTPNVSASEGRSQPRYTIRGITTDDFGIGSDPAVGVYQDGVYISRSGASRVAFSDLERVEILNGPQGTLFGRNAAAGAIQYVTKKPVAETEGFAKLTLGNHNKHTVEGVYNTALTDQLFFRAGALYNQRDGEIDDVFDGDDFGGEDDWSINMALRWQPNEKVDALFRLEYHELNSGARAQSSATLPPRDNGNGNPGEFTQVANDTPTYQWRDLFGASLHVTVDYDTFQLVSITGWRSFESQYREERDGSADPFFSFDDENYEDNSMLSQEWRLESSNDSKLRWVVGAAYFHEEAEQRSSLFLSTPAIDKFIVEELAGFQYDPALAGLGFDIAFAAPPEAGGFLGIPRIYASGADAYAAGTYSESISIDATYESYAAFADFTYSVNDKLDLTAGIRYTRDEKEFGNFVGYNDFGIAVAFTQETRINAAGQLDPNGDVGFYIRKDDWAEVTSRFVADYHVNDDVLVYASWSQGYKAGGYNSAGEINAPAFDPEDVTNIEIGAKATLFDGRFRVNAAFFDYEYNNLQKLELVPSECLPNSDTDAQLFVTSDVEGKGFELAVDFAVTDGLTVFANTGNLDAEYSRREDSEAVAGGCQIIDRSGESFEESADLNYSVGANYLHSLNNGASVEFNVAYSFASGADNVLDCRFINQDADGVVSVYQALTIDNVVQITEGGAAAANPLTEPPFASCPDEFDEERLNARVTYSSAADNWEVSAYVINATNDVRPSYEPGGLGGSLASGFTDGSPTYSNSEPRLYGVELKFLF